LAFVMDKLGGPTEEDLVLLVDPHYLELFPSVMLRLCLGCQWVPDKEVAEAYGFAVLAAFTKAQAQSCDLLRDIFPLHSINLDSTWLTSTVLTLAQQMHDTRDFSAMPILSKVPAATAPRSLSTAGNRGLI
jgi:hypothetical protein